MIAADEEGRASFLLFRSHSRVMALVLFWATHCNNDHPYQKDEDVVRPHTTQMGTMHEPAGKGS
jgi:hypothetical protein